MKLYKLKTKTTNKTITKKTRLTGLEGIIGYLTKAATNSMPYLKKIVENIFEKNS